MKERTITKGVGTPERASRRRESRVESGRKMEKVAPTTLTTNDDVDDDSVAGATPTDAAIIPIAMRLRLKDQQQERKQQNSKLQRTETIDEEIERLERELANDDDDDDDDDDDSNDSCDSEQDDDSTSLDQSGHNDQQEKLQPQDGVILALSEFAKDRVQHLPPSALPKPGRYKSDTVTITEKVKSKKRKREPTSNNSEQAGKAPPAAVSGLEQAVQEVLNGYQARSSERIPFYCRFCSQQFANLEEFNQHQSTDFHQAVVAAERKATYCRLCRKQLTSLVQMKEHLKSRPHHERLLLLQSKRSTNHHHHHHHPQEGGLRSLPKTRRQPPKHQG
jgi:hypothetical protein